MTASIAVAIRPLLFDLVLLLEAAPDVRLTVELLAFDVFLAAPDDLVFPPPFEELAFEADVLDEPDLDEPDLEELAAFEDRDDPALDDEPVDFDAPPLDELDDLDAPALDEPDDLDELLFAPDFADEELRDDFEEDPPPDLDPADDFVPPDFDFVDFDALDLEPPDLDVPAFEVEDFLVVGIFVSSVLLE